MGVQRRKELEGSGHSGDCREKADAGCFYVQKNGTTEVIMASVNLKETSKAADHMVLLDSGRQVYMGTDAIYLYEMEYEREKRQRSPSFLIRMECFQQLQKQP